jgi:hypothetical protein
MMPVAYTELKSWVSHIACIDALEKRRFDFAVGN